MIGADENTTKISYNEIVYFSNTTKLIAKKINECTVLGYILSQLFNILHIIDYWAWDLFLPFKNHWKEENILSITPLFPMEPSVQSWCTGNKMASDV